MRIPIAGYLAWAALLFFAYVATNSEVRGAEALPIVADVEYQPLSAQVRRIVEALKILGQPLARDEEARIGQALDTGDLRLGVRIFQEVLDRHCLIGVDINPESRVKAAQGPAAARAGPERLERVPGQGA